jgi:septal ring factor EnvC (AmiA/AmiB activator)
MNQRRLAELMSNVTRLGESLRNSQDEARRLELTLQETTSRLSSLRAEINEMDGAHKASLVKLREFMNANV